MSSPRSILCLTTGGSIDKTYSSLASDFVVAGPTASRTLREAKCGHDVKFAEICRKDSLELTDGDRAAVLSAVANAKQKFVVVTHGTDTMWKTALAVRPTALRLGKVVVLTGAMRPAAFKATDAHFNLGSAFTVAPFLPPGAHIVMNGRVFSDPEKVVKDYDRDVFHEGDARAAAAPPKGPPSSRQVRVDAPPKAPPPPGKKKGPKSRESVVVEGTLDMSDEQFERQFLAAKKPPAPKKKPHPKSRESVVVDGSMGLSDEQFEKKFLKKPAGAAKKRAKSRESVIVDTSMDMSDKDFEAQFLKKDGADDAAAAAPPKDAAAPAVGRGARGRGGRGGGRGRGRGGRGGPKGGPEAVPEPATAE